MTKSLSRAFQATGAHMSISGGLSRCFERGMETGCETIQIFTKSSNQWRAKPLTTEDVDAFLDAAEQSGIGPVVAHDSYLINLASPKPELLKKSTDALAEELKRCALLQIPYLVMHPGSHVGEGDDAGINRIAETLNRLLNDEVGGNTTICLETTAGQGTNIGHRFEHLAAIIDKLDNQDRVGVCVDTCHIFAAGYELDTQSQWDATFKEFDQVVGLDRIRCFHVNDSKREAGSRVDRHEEIGKGHMGLEPFRHLMNDKRFHALPKLLETPKGKDKTKEADVDRENLATLRGMIGT